MSKISHHSYSLKNGLSLCYWGTAAAKSLQGCPTLRNPIDGSQPGSAVPGILQARILEWVAISSFNACMHAKPLLSCPTVRSHEQQPTRLLCPQDSLGKSTGVGCHSKIFIANLQKKIVNFLFSLGLSSFSLHWNSSSQKSL